MSAAVQTHSRSSTTVPALAPLAPPPALPASFPRSFPERRTLTAGDRIVVRAMAEAMFSQDGEVEAARLDGLVSDVDAYVSAASKPIRSGLRIALWVVRFAPILMFFRMCTLERLAVEPRVTFLSRLERSRFSTLSLAFIGWRTVMTLIFYEDPAELRNVGYAGEERLRYKRRLPALVLAPPPAEESGVRLRGDRDSDSDSEHLPAVAPAAPAEEASGREALRSRDVA